MVFGFLKKKSPIDEWKNSARLNYETWDFEGREFSRILCSWGIKSISEAIGDLENMDIKLEDKSTPQSIEDCVLTSASGLCVEILGQLSRKLDLSWGVLDEQLPPHLPKLIGFGMILADELNLWIENDRIEIDSTELMRSVANSVFSGLPTDAMELKRRNGITQAYELFSTYMSTQKNSEWKQKLGHLAVTYLQQQMGLKEKISEETLVDGLAKFFEMWTISIDQLASVDC